MNNTVKISDHFWIIEENGVRSFLFEGDKRAMLIDTGFGTLQLEELLAGLTKLPVFLVNTHTDEDHTGCNRYFDVVYMHPAEMNHYKEFLPEGCRMEQVYPVWEGDIIDLGFWRFEVILTPGHTPGSIMLLERNKRMLISGDTIQDGDIFMFGAGRNMQAFQSSLRKISAMAGAFDSIWPSHGSYPLAPDIIPGILQGAQDMLAGRLVEQEPPWPMPCKRYVSEAAGFLYRFEDNGINSGKSSDNMSF
ncbi:MAG: MBL fold metallo-hydrolase [Roseburia sp.]|nr:MBL fold metallo-hydrolase [Roseburia sp.]